MAASTTAAAWFLLAVVVRLQATVPAIAAGDDEAQALLAATFAKYDANKDGKIGGDERSAAKSQMQGSR